MCEPRGDSPDARPSRRSPKALSPAPPGTGRGRGGTPTDGAAVH